MKSVLLAVAIAGGAAFLGYQVGGIVAIHETVNLMNRGVR